MWEKILNTIGGHLSQMGAFVPNLLTALAILIIGLIIARSLRSIITKLLHKTGIDGLADRLNTVDLVARAPVDIVPSKLVGAIVYYFIFFVFVMASVEALGMQAISKLMNDMIAYIPKAISAFFVLVVGILFCDLIKKLVHTSLTSLGIGAARFIASVVFYFLFVNIALVTLRQAELETTFMENNMSIIFGGIVLAFSIGYGLASRGLMANMLASFYHKSRFDVDDELTVDGIRGKVIYADSTSLTLRTREDAEVIIPLSKLAEEKFIVHQRKRYTRIQGGDSTD